MEVLEPEFPVCSPSHEAPAASAMYKFSIKISEAAAKTGIDTLVARRFRGMLEAQGFVNVGEVCPKWPIGTWPRGGREKDIGMWTLKNTKQFVPGCRAAACEESGVVEAGAGGDFGRYQKGFG